MIYCFDIDGTITRYPKVLSEMMLALMKAGHKVYPLTGMLYTNTPFPMEEYEAHRLSQLKSFGLEKGTHFEDVVVCVAATFDEAGELKGKFCQENGVDFMIDDVPGFVNSINKHSPSTFCAWVPN